MYSGYGIAFDGNGEWSFDNDYARNNIIFGVDNSSSCHADNLKNNFSILGGGDTLVLMEALVHQKKGLVLTLAKQTENFV